MVIKVINLNGIRYADVSRYEALLPPERREKICRLRFERDKLLSLTAGLLIRAEMGEVPLKTNACGKPYAVDSDKFFSVSHSGVCAAIAADDAEVGVDIEKLPDREYGKLSERFFHPNELQYVRCAENQPRAFARIWTRKEAYLKQRGCGVTEDLRAFDTTSQELSERIRSFDLDGYALSVCAANTLPNTIYISDIELSQLLS